MIGKRSCRHRNGCQDRPPEGQPGRNQARYASSFTRNQRCRPSGEVCWQVSSLTRNQRSGPEGCWQASSQSQSSGAKSESTSFCQACSLCGPFHGLIGPRRTLAGPQPEFCAARSGHQMAQMARSDHSVAPKHTSLQPNRAAQWADRTIWLMHLPPFSLLRRACTADAPRSLLSAARAPLMHLQLDG